MQEEDEPGSPRNALIALIVVVVLIAGGLWITRQLHSMAAIQDCASSGRTNCAPIKP
jgi:heme/copper-type cytochrome/quinol oxidase subunit 4